MPAGWRLVLVLTAAGVALAAYRLRTWHLNTMQAHERKQNTLLGMAADACCEVDGEGRLLALCSQQTRSAAVMGRDDLGRTLWELPGLSFEPAALTGLRADLRTGRSFRDLALQRQAPDGSVHHLRSAARRGVAPMAPCWATGCCCAT